MSENSEDEHLYRYEYGYDRNGNSIVTRYANYVIPEKSFDDEEKVRGTYFDRLEKLTVILGKKYHRYKKMETGVFKSETERTFYFQLANAYAAEKLSKNIVVSEAEALNNILKDKKHFVKTILADIKDRINHGPKIKKIADGVDTKNYVHLGGKFYVISADHLFKDLGI